MSSHQGPTGQVDPWGPNQRLLKTQGDHPCSYSGKVVFYCRGGKPLYIKISNIPQYYLFLYRERVQIEGASKFEITIYGCGVA